MKGFTVVELLVVLAISAILSTFAIGYSSVSRNYIALTVQESKIAQVILQAKELAIATYASASGLPVCGYGMRISTSSPQTFSIFAYSPSTAPPCPTETALASNGINPDDEKQYTPATWKIPLAGGVKIKTNADSLSSVLFYPPNPDVFLSVDGKILETTTTLKIYLVTIDGQNNATISISPGGQVSI